MAMSFLNVRADFDEITEALTDEEKGRLLLAMVRYARDGIEPQLSGAERILWPVFRAEIDHDLAVYQTKVENGRRPKRCKTDESEPKQTEADGSEPKRNEADGSGTKRTEAEKNPLFEEKEAEKDREQEKRTKREIEKEKGEEKERENAPARVDAQGLNGFDAFWNSYPRKEGKKAARKAWDKIRPDPVLQMQISNALRNQKECDQWTRDGGQFIPHPATWLNGERWKDETVLPARASPGRSAAVPAQMYGQRDYSGEQDDAMLRMIAGMDEIAAVVP